MSYTLFANMNSMIPNFKSYFTWENTENTSPYKNMMIDTSNKFNENSSIRVSSSNAVNLKVDFFNKKYNSVKALIASYYLYYPNDFYIRYPEYVVYKLGLDKKILNGLPEYEKRKREHVRNWMFHSKLTLEEFNEVGF